MKRLLVFLAATAVALLPGVGSGALATGAAVAATSPAADAGGAGPAFDDVPPCHWAAEAVRKVASAGIFVGFPPDPAYDSVNALRQVFEGLRCGRPSWSTRFLSGAPDAFASQEGPSLVRFRLVPKVVSSSANKVDVAFRLTAVFEQDGVQRTLARRGTAALTRTEAGWKVAYGELAGLDLPFFPR